MEAVEGGTEVASGVGEPPQHGKVEIIYCKPERKRDINEHVNRIVPLDLWGEYDGLMPNIVRESSKKDSLSHVSLCFPSIPSIISTIIMSRNGIDC